MNSMTDSRYTGALPIRRGLALLTLSASLLLGGCSLLSPRPLGAESPMPALSSLEQTTTRRLSLRVERMEEEGTTDDGALSAQGDGQDRLPPLLGVLKQSPQAMRLVLLSVQGQRLLTLVHDADGSRFEKVRPEVAETLPFTADWLARRIAWVHWPRASLDNAFTGTDWTLVQHGDWDQPSVNSPPDSPSDSPSDSLHETAQRIILKGADTIAELNRDIEGRVTLRDPETEMQLILTPLAATGTPHRSDASPEAPTND